MVDLVVIGAGPAGLAAAIAARLAGMSVVVADRRRPPLEKACGEGLMPAGARALARLGVVIPFARSFPFTGIRYIDYRNSGAPVVASARFPSGTGLGLPRAVLHEAMARRAGDLGASFLWGGAFVGLHPEGARIEDGVVRARWIVGADGHASAVRRALGIDDTAVSRRVGLRRRYRIVPWTDQVEVHWSAGFEAYVTPVGPREISVAILSERRPATFEEALRGCPGLARRLEGIEASSPDLAAPTIFRPSAEAARGNVALVGDAAGSVDAMTGEGMTLGLLGALSLTASLRRGSLTHYARDHARLVRGSNRLSGLMLAIERRPKLRHAVMNGLAAAPRLFEGILGRHSSRLCSQLAAMQ